MKKVLLVLVLGITVLAAKAQTNEAIYEEAFEKIDSMLSGTLPISFKEAVFTVENAYFSNTLERERFDSQINLLTNLSRKLIDSRDLIYDLQDKEDVEKCAALFTVMTDTIPVQLDSNEIGYILPYTYDFDDIWGDRDWSNMFVSKLLTTKKGNCHSMPLLYKILADEIGVKSYLAIAPNHFYIKHQNKSAGWYNTELTSGIFPQDAWLMASGYIHLDAIVNKLYMEALNEKQSLAVCLIDLVKGYERKLGSMAKPDFILKCCDAALKYYPNYINALLLKAEMKKTAFDELTKSHGVQNPNEIMHIKEAQELFNEMTILYAKIHELGYRRMPEEMYLKWLVSLKEEREKYENKKISNFNSKSN
jgi:hypothetical protein